MSADKNDPLVWSVDRSWAQYTGNSDGNFAESDTRRFHIDRGDSTAKCSTRVLLNSLAGDRPIGRLSEISPALRAMVCRRCVPALRMPRR
jgi:hypothetical protein